ncbi:glycosyltransferase family 4 protein [Clostridium pasteurianum]|uniref:glycosyltransferase family 4 protein n=1 Tax=Clostridium pasteurianum TaxID=1501 RepID=UPI002260FDC5|nr:glycosyltransferase family 4 protein [Clostridium pasteurianum]UZW14975.1 glycosyltransferase family 4 protein [Clostridium pasteurianum]
MKICFVMSNICTLGGVQRVVSVLCNELIKYYEIDILCVSKEIKNNGDLYKLNSKINVKFKYNFVKTNLIDKSFRKIVKDINKFVGILNNERYYTNLLNIYFPIKVRTQFIEYLNYNKYDVVIGVEGLYSILLGSIKEKLNSKVIGWQHNSYEAYLKNKNKYYWNLNILFNKYVSKLDRYIVLNEHDDEMYMKEMGISCDVIYNPTSFKSDIKSKVNSNIFLAAGRFNYQKGFDLLLQSFKVFSMENTDWKLVIVGDGEEKNKLLKTIKEFQLEDRVEIHNFTNNISDYFLKSSVLLLSSRWEGMPMIVLEALEMGVPIITYDITAVRPLVTHMVEGVIVNKFDITAFADAMIRISKSENLRKNMSRNAISKSKLFDISTIIKKWQNLLI